MNDITHKLYSALNNLLEAMDQFDGKLPCMNRAYIDAIEVLLEYEEEKEKV